MAIEIILHGVKMTVTKDQLFELAANGGITKDTPVNVSGKLVAAKQIKGLVFGKKEMEQDAEQPVVVSPAVPVQNTVPSTSEQIEVILHGVNMPVSKERLFELAANGAISPDTPVNVFGTLTPAHKFKGISFADAPISRLGNFFTSTRQNVEKTICSHLDIATPSDRLIAHLLDGLYMLLLICPFALFVILCPLYFLCPMIAMLLGVNLYRDPSVTNLQITGFGFLVLIVGAAWTWIWLILTNWVNTYWVFYFAKGTTLGKRSLGLHIVDAKTGEAPSVSKLLIRNIIGKWFISPLIFSLGYIWILIDQNNQCWHDKFVNTIVIKKEPDPIPCNALMPFSGYRSAVIITIICSLIDLGAFCISAFGFWK